MKRNLVIAAAGMLCLGSTSGAWAQSVQSNLKLNCTVSGVYADGTRVSGSGTEDISVEVRPASLAAPASNDIRVTANGRSYQATLLRSTPTQLAFSYASDAVVDGVAQTLALTYEIRLDQSRLKRTVMALFSNQAGNTLTAEGNCVRPGVAAAGAAAPAATATTPDWVVELRRKLKECNSKDPLSAVTCTERVQGRLCANRSIKVPECEGK
jgi:hypothetical protein